MLALAVTLVFALYVLGPDAFSRFILGFGIPRRSVSLTKGEEVYRAVIWSGTAFAVSFLWLKLTGELRQLWIAQNLKDFITGLSSEQFFREHQAVWFHAFHSTLWLCWAALWRVYLIVLVMSAILLAMTHYYGGIRHWLRKSRVVREGLAMFVLPRIAQWHLLLSPILLRNRSWQIHLDILMKDDKLYQGRLADKMLTADGSLISIMLADPKRFRREEYTEEKKKGNSPNPDTYWKPIPTNMFLLMASEISTINFRHLPAGVREMKITSEDFQIALKQVAEQLRSVRQASSKLAGETSTENIKK